MPPEAGIEIERKGRERERLQEPGKFQVSLIHTSNIIMVHYSIGLAEEE